jgi:hypothetical protein
VPAPIKIANERVSPYFPIIRPKSFIFRRPDRDRTKPESKLHANPMILMFRTRPEQAQKKPKKKAAEYQRVNIDPVKNPRFGTFRHPENQIYFRPPDSYFIRF